MAGMRWRFASQMVAALLVPALLASGAAQALVVRCDAAVMSCCAKKTETSGSAVTGQRHKCCPEASAPTQQEAAQKTAVPPAPAPVLVAIAGPVVSITPRAVQERADVPALDPPEGPPLVLANCSLLI